MPAALPTESSATSLILTTTDTPLKRPHSNVQQAPPPLYNSRCKTGCPLYHPWPPPSEVLAKTRLPVQRDRQYVTPTSHSKCTIWQPNYDCVLMNLCTRNRARRALKQLSYLGMRVDHATIPLAQIALTIHRPGRGDTNCSLKTHKQVHLRSDTTDGTRIAAAIRRLETHIGPMPGMSHIDISTTHPYTTTDEQLMHRSALTILGDHHNTILGSLFHPPTPTYQMIHRKVTATSQKNGTTTSIHIHDICGICADHISQQQHQPSNWFSTARYNDISGTET